MNIELFSLRTSKQDIENINNNLRNISEELAIDGFYVKYKTEVDLNKQRIKKALDSSVESESKPDIIVVANALTSRDSSSFKNLFADIIAECESEIQDPAPKKSKKDKNAEDSKYYIKKIKIFSMGDLGNSYNGYCFTYKGTRVVVLPKTSLTGKETADLFSHSVLLATQIFDKNEQIYPGGINLIEGKPKKKSLAKRIFPCKGDSGKEKTRKSISLIAFFVFFVTAVLLFYNLVYLPMQNNAIQSEIQKIFYNEDDDDKGGTDIKTKDWNALKKINKDIVGWIKLDNTVIDYPVLRNKDDDENYQYYLNHNYKKEYSGYGSIFVDYRCTKGTNSKNVVLHGHHMNDGSMFGNLLNYGKTTGDLKFYKKTPTITFDTPDGDATYKIISVFKTNSLSVHGEFFNYMIGDFNSDSEFMNFVYNIRMRSLFNCPVSVNEDDTLLTLSTCSYEFSEFRTVVVARKVRIGEDPKVDVSKASLNKNPVWPQVYYSSYGGTRPKVTTFKTAYKAGEIDWYDGTGDPTKLKGKEEAPTEPTTNESDKNKNNTATEAPAVIKYTVTFIDFDGNTIKTEQVEKGKSATPPATNPTKSDEYYDYIFTGWQLDYTNVQSDMIIAGNYEPVLKQ
ncbi:MAG: class B sortase [Ruminococcus sp.]|nr:class B sortase [Ruminococcus sp.]